jgi:hypothetical protein
MSNVLFKAAVAHSLAAEPVVDAHAGSALVTAEDRAASDGMLPDSVPTIYYVNFTPDVAEEVRPELQKLQQNILDFRSWATLQTNLLLRRKIDSGAIDSNDRAKIGSYRAKVMEAYYNERAS